MGKETHEQLIITSLNDLSVTQWGELVKSVVREDIVHCYIIAKKPLPAAVDALPQHAVTVQLPVDHRSVNEFGESVAVATLVKHLPDRAKERMRSGFSLAITGTSNSTAEGWDIVIKGILELAQMIGGVLERAPIDKVLKRRDLPSELKEQVRRARRHTRH